VGQETQIEVFVNCVLRGVFEKNRENCTVRSFISIDESKRMRWEEYVARM
jgi:hypothetical protein